MMRKFKEGLIFGAGFAISYLFLWYATSYWIAPILTASRIEQINKEMSGERESRTSNEPPRIAHRFQEEKPFHELPLEEQIKSSSAIALARYEKSSDGKVKAIIKEFLKREPGITIYYDVGDEFAPSSYYPKENTSYGDGVVIFFEGSPATMRMSMSFSGDRINSLGDLPIALLKKKCDNPGA